LHKLLKSYNLSDKAISIYRESIGKFPFSLGEIKKYMPKLSDDQIEPIMDDLIEKKLVILIKPQQSDAIPHYIFIPPFSAVINSFTELMKVSANEPQEQNSVQNIQLTTQIEKFQDNLFQDIESVSQDLITAITDQVNNNQTTEILTEVEQNVKKFVQVIINNIIKSINALRRETVVDQRDLVRLFKAAKQKLEEAEEIATNMFTQFRDIVGEMQTSNISPQVESFKTFIRTLGQSIDKRVHEISLPSIGDSSSASLDKIKSIEKSVTNILSDYINKNKLNIDKYWNVTSYEKVKEVISYLLDKSTKELIIIVPNIELFLPLEKFNLDYSKDLSLKQQILSSGPVRMKPKKPSGLSISKKKHKEVETELDGISKKVSSFKGFELSHSVAEILGLISEVNPKSVIIESIQGWLNRLLVIRKLLDANTQYLFLEAIEKWKKEYLNIQKEEEPEESEEEVSEEPEDQVSAIKPVVGGLQITIISSEPHDNKHILALNNKDNIEYLQIIKNNIIGIVGDDSYLLFGIGEKVPMKSIYVITGFLTNFKPLIDALYPQILRLRTEAKPPKEIQINIGFNEIIENINDYSGKKIAEKLNNLLHVTFEKEGISLQVLELKLMIGKLEKIYYALEDDMKEYVIKGLNALNKELSPLDLISPPEFKPPMGEEEPQVREEIIPEEEEIEPFDPDKINSLFEIFLEKTLNLKGVEIVDQIDKFIEIVLKLQGYTPIIDWKNSLRDVDKELEEQFKEKFKADFLKWKRGILHQSSSIETPIVEQSPESYSSPYVQSSEKQEDTVSILDEGYTSPGLAQSQFTTEEESSSSEETTQEDPSVKMKEYFDTIQSNLGEMSGLDISKVLQNIMDIILETEGYSMALKSAKDWISKLRMIRKPLTSELKEDFELELLKMKEKYIKDDEDEILDFGSSIAISGEPDDDLGDLSEGGLSAKFEGLIQNAHTLAGNELSNELQDIADIILQSHGAVAANAIRQWISKLRSIRSPLEEKIKDEFIAELTNWIEKFA